jgi:hypothetical protein
VTTRRGTALATVEVSDTLRDGHVTLPNGMGLECPNERGERTVHGTPPNELTSGEDRDWLWEEGEKPPIELFDRDSGQPVRPRVVDQNTGIPIDVRRVRVRSRQRD